MRQPTFKTAMLPPAALEAIRAFRSEVQQKIGQEAIYDLQRGEALSMPL